MSIFDKKHLIILYRSMLQKFGLNLKRPHVDTLNGWLDRISDDFTAIFGRSEGRSFTFFDGGDNGNRAIVLGDGEGFACLYRLDK
jgi:hypothetical protein